MAVLFTANLTPSRAHANHLAHPFPAEWALDGAVDESHWGLYSAYFKNDTAWLDTFIGAGFAGVAPWTDAAARAQVGLCTRRRCTWQCSYWPCVCGSTAAGREGGWGVLWDGRRERAAKARGPAQRGCRSWRRIGVAPWTGAHTPTPFIASSFVPVSPRLPFDRLSLLHAPLPGTPPNTQPIHLPILCLWRLLWQTVKEGVRSNLLVACMRLQHSAHPLPSSLLSQRFADCPEGRAVQPAGGSHTAPTL